LSRRSLVDVDLHRLTGYRPPNRVTMARQAVTLSA
jgi:hypothetical protein